MAYKFPFFSPPENSEIFSLFDFVLQGLHPRIIAEGFESAKEKALAVLEELKVTREMDRETLINVARTSLRTKVYSELADLLTEVRHKGKELSVPTAEGLQLTLKLKKIFDLFGMWCLKKKLTFRVP